MGSTIADLQEHYSATLGWLKETCQVAGNLCTDEETGQSNGWKDMEATADALGKVLAQLEAAITPGVAEAIRQEQAYQDDCADRADGQSY